MRWRETSGLAKHFREASAAGVKRMRPKRGNATARIVQLEEENARLRATLRLIENHELRDHEDYEAIKEIATRALSSAQQGTATE